MKRLLFALLLVAPGLGCTHSPDAEDPPATASQPGAASQPASMPASMPAGGGKKCMKDGSGPKGQPGQPGCKCKHHGKGGPHGMHKHHRFDDPAKWAQRFEDPKRDEWQKPDVVLELMELKSTDVVADIGAATGYFPVRIAPKAAKVYGVDIEPTMVEYLDQRAAKESIPNLKGVLGTADDPKLPEAVDVILVVDTYHHIGDRSAYFGKLKDKLKPGARVVIVDFKKGELPMGPPDRMKLAPEVVEAEFKEAGFVLKTKETEKLPHQYVLVFTVAE